jgi:pimeloyl-ACP methyl ester carboxylesterase
LRADHPENGVKIARRCTGHGDSDGRVLNLAIGARAVQAVAESYGGITGIVAHSFGCPISALAAEGGLPLSHPMPVERMVLIASPNSLATVTNNFANRVGLPKGAMRALESEILRIAGRPVASYEVGPFLARITKPTLLIHDEGDTDVPFSRAGEIVAQAPHVRLLRTTGLGHRKIVVAPKAIKAAVAFLSGTRVTGAGDEREAAATGAKEEPASKLS